MRVFCREAFSCEQQFGIVSKYIVDQSQAANFKVRQPTICVFYNVGFIVYYHMLYIYFLFS